MALHDRGVFAEPPSYWVILTAREGVPGHAFVLWIHENTVQGSTDVEAFGMYPAVAAPEVLKAAFGPVPGALTDEIVKSRHRAGCCSWTANDVIASFAVDSQTFERTVKVRKDWANSVHEYQLLKEDCVSFVIQTGRAMGLAMPDRGVLNANPVGYIKSLLESLETPNEDGGLRVKVNNGGGPRTYILSTQRDSVSFRLLPPAGSNQLDGVPRRDEVSRSITFMTPMAGETNFRPRTRVVETVGRQIRQIDYFDDGEESQDLFGLNGIQHDTNNRYTFRDGTVYEHGSDTPNETNAPSRVWGNGTYAGDWKAFLPSGHGTWKSQEGVVYTGQWLDGRPWGQGVAKWPNGEQYNGQWLAGRFHGTGTYTWPNGANFQGTFENGVAQRGAMTDRNGVSHNAGNGVNTADRNYDHGPRDRNQRDDDLRGHVSEFDSRGNKIGDREIRGMEIKGNPR